MYMQKERHIAFHDHITDIEKREDPSIELKNTGFVYLAFFLYTNLGKRTKKGRYRKLV